MKKKLGIMLIAMLGLCSVSCSTTPIIDENNYPTRYAAVVYADETSGEPDVVEEQPVEEKDEVKEWLNEFFSPDKIAMYISWITYIGTIIGLVGNIKKLKQSNNLTLKNVSDEVKTVLQETISEEVSKKFDDMLPSILQTQEKTNQIMSIFAKILALSQENTPESKVAILNLIEELGTVSKEVVDNAKEVIDAGVKLAEQAKEELDQKIDEIVDSYDGTSI